MIKIWNDPMTTHIFVTPLYSYTPLSSPALSTTIPSLLGTTNFDPHLYCFVICGWDKAGII